MSITVAKLHPCAALAPFVRYFQNRHGSILHAPIGYPIAARPEQFVEFYLRDRHEIVAADGRRRDRSPAVVLVGPQCVNGGELVLKGEFDVFTIHFQPTGLSRLFGVSLREFTDRAVDGTALLGASWLRLHAELQAAKDLRTRRHVAERFLLRSLPGAAAFHPLDAVAAKMLWSPESVDLSTLARRSHLCTRQFERRFESAVGVLPKLYSRIVRFSRVLRRKSADPRRSWTHLAHETGYHDHMHLVRDCKLLAGLPPSHLQQRRSAAGLWSPPEEPAR